MRKLLEVTQLLRSLDLDSGNWLQRLGWTMVLRCLREVKGHAHGVQLVRAVKLDTKSDTSEV